MADAFDGILGQPLVRDFLRSSLQKDKITSAYLFLGPAGSNKTSAAYALAKAILCPLDDKTIRGSRCGKCDICQRIAKNNFADVKYCEPESASGYLVEQIRRIIHDINLAPIEGNKKVYIIDSVDMMGVSSANAFLKTLEEPPDNVVLILLGRSKESILSTIVSRCSVVAFRHIPPTTAYGIISQNTGCETSVARIALESCGGSITKAIEFVRAGDNSHLYLRSQMLELIFKVPKSNSWQICQITRELLSLIKVPSDEYLRKREQKSSDESEFLSAAAIKEASLKTKREASKKTSDMLSQLIYIMLSILKDIESMILETNCEVINYDYRSEVEDLCRKTNISKLCRSMSELCKKKDYIAYNVSSELLINTCLFDFRGAFNDEPVINR